MKSKKKDEQVEVKYAEPVQINIEDFIANNGIEYAQYVIQNRALLENDGLKNVNRRILYSMYREGMRPDGKTRKALKVVGDVMGNFHPHGDSSISDALAGMCQTFAQRLPLFFAQGAVGKFTGDIAAQPRYWEVGMTKISWELVKDLQYKCVPFKEGELDNDEPAYLPIGFPVGIINGTDGVGVGYASKIPSHNPEEVMTACLERLKGKVKTVDDLLQIMPGPDFPTGGIVQGVDGIREYFETGVGRFTIKGKYRIIEGKNRTQIEFYELPYQIPAPTIKAQVYKVQDDGKALDGIREVKLLDGMAGNSLMFYLERGANVDQVIEELFKYTGCAVSYSVNATVLVDRKPVRTVGMLGLIDQFLTLKKAVCRQKLENKRIALQKEVEKNEGLIPVILDVDKAIEIIRKADNSEVAKANLIKHFNINEQQAEYVLSLKLKTLTKADKHELLAKIEEIKQELARTEQILADDKLFKKEVARELEETKKIIAIDERRTVIENITNEELEQQAKEKAKQEKALNKGIPCYLTVAKGKVTKTTEQVPNALEVSSIGNYVAISKQGDAYVLPVQDLPLDKAVELTKVAPTKDIVGITRYDTEQDTLVATNQGNVNIVKGNYREGSFATLSEQEEIIFVQALKDTDVALVFVDEDGRIAKIDISTIRRSNQGAGLIKGVILDTIISVHTVQEHSILYTKTLAQEKWVSIEDCPSKGRGNRGYIFHKLGKGDRVISSAVYQEVTKKMTLSNRGEKGEKLQTPTLLKK